jgi:hypothetical protein
MLDTETAVYSQSHKNQKNALVGRCEISYGGTQS